MRLRLSAQPHRSTLAPALGLRAGRGGVFFLTQTDPAREDRADVVRIVPPIAPGPGGLAPTVPASPTGGAGGQGLAEHLYGAEPARQRRRVAASGRPRCQCTLRRPREPLR